ncbi:MAG: type 2 isopentenyl-diphosphate Delta-isomerase [Thermoproteota archaeon]|uniref:Isopentenyl-diphosphate delta-isomerase n=1 Tax=Candidatus Methanodesulfokora washburnensis TaxID=2478471 RepID=A0A520KHU2_9CREN|nr:MAG: type 2 isopentenyl-diphosphate Delta-isomerase [Candidatus Methanodesulfokores washburnensis]TDA38609.1 MAG: type 2 isopentenyl-diphosphate Delta-isomerase [Candidatus Korarchaeota archaeon]
MQNETSKRKIEHIELALLESVERKEMNWFDEVILLHHALPDISPDEIDLSSNFAGKPVKAPIIIEAITGGSDLSKGINEALAIAASEFGVAIGVGSQRAMLEDKSLIDTYKIVRERAPDVPLIANLGMSHISTEKAVENAKAVVEAIEADALAIHLNFLQELLQPEGCREFPELFSNLVDISREVDVPLVVKEVGNGISGEVATLLESAGASYIDVAGAGGTNWAVIEGSRSGGLRRDTAYNFINWGIPTVIGIIEVRKHIKRAKIIGSGGIRTGIDAAKAIALGAHFVGAARPFLVSFKREGLDGIRSLLKRMIEELRLSMALTNSRSVEELRLSRRFVLTGRTLEWALQRNIL